MEPSSVLAPKPSPVSRLGRIAGMIVLVSVVLLVGLFATTHLVHPSPPGTPLPLRLALAVAVLVGPLWLVVARFRRVPRPLGPWLAMGASLTLFIGWLLRDDPTLLHDTLPPALRSDFPGAEASHALTLRYSKGAPGTLDGTLPESKLVFPTLSAEPDARTKWVKFLTDNRPALDARWAEIAPVRAWIAELAAQPALADITDGMSDPILAFKPIREVCQNASAQASLLILEGRRDEAVALLLPSLAASQKLEIHARTLVRRMIAIVLQRQVYATLTFVLDQGELSAATREDLARALSPHQDPTEGARLLLLGENFLATRLILEVAAYPDSIAMNAELNRLAGPALRLLYDPRATANRLGDFLTAGADLAAARASPEEIDRHTQEFERGLALNWPGKNLIGRRLLALIVPAYTKVTTSYWDAQDQRATLVARLGGKGN